jgi:hypothetical protein
MLGFWFILVVSTLLIIMMMNMMQPGPPTVGNAIANHTVSHWMAFVTVSTCVLLVVLCGLGRLQQPLVPLSVHSWLVVVLCVGGALALTIFNSVCHQFVSCFCGMVMLRVVHCCVAQHGGVLRRAGR